MFILYIFLLCITCTITCLKIIPTLKSFIDKKNASHPLRPQWAVALLLGGSLALTLPAARWSGRWLPRAGVAVAVSENKTTLTFFASMGSSFLRWFLCSTRCGFLPSYPQLSIFQSQCQASQPATSFPTKFPACSQSFVVISSLHSASPAAVSILRNHLLCFSLRSNFPSVKVLWDCSNLVIFSGSNSNSSSLLFPPHLQCYPPQLG